MVVCIFDEKINSTGWDFLEIYTKNLFSDIDQAYYAGYCEGILTH